MAVDFLGFTPDQVAQNVGRFAGRTGQYVFISSASVYRKPSARLPVVKSVPLENPYTTYARGKTAC
ncbi:hypothetical protein ACFV6B_26700 [Streptomyces microflavus]|uniref:hypothetical protein n=1 Tax=Streptomyces microflavus TaxID=1919 RepID=UPI00365D148C